MSIPTRLGAAMMLVAVMAGSTVAPPAAADPNDYALNGRFTAISDGQWAKTNERFHDEATVTSTWTIRTSCRTAIDCSGQVSSDQGWTADVTYDEPMWYVTRTVDDWMTCPDGTSVAGQQIIKFFIDHYDEPNLRGWDNTLGPSGACGINKVLDIELPFKLIPIA
ncbi:hypothetical protein [Mycolicibacterium sp.]|uniref:hypothetical protein n=1 Tax=Mycolicibacterium sp. TaxID=2320850 RepID=UPI0037C852EE